MGDKNESDPVGLDVTTFRRFRRLPSLQILVPCSVTDSELSKLEEVVLVDSDLVTVGSVVELELESELLMVLLVFFLDLTVLL